ncbi:MAG: inner membrane CreD family protein [Acidobacteria bacterium]|nr:inner membrane CreD family protein [Acidobacteriota bacterium]
MLGKITALVFIFICTTIAWMILGGTLSLRTASSNSLLSGRVGSTWGQPQVQSPPTACYDKTEPSTTTTIENGKTLVRTTDVKRTFCLPLASTHAKVDIDLQPRLKGLLWYSTYTVSFAGDYEFTNTSDHPTELNLSLPLPGQRANYDSLTMLVNGQTAPLTVGEQSAGVQTRAEPGQTLTLHTSYRSQGLDSWRYKLADGIAKANNFSLVMHTNFRDIDFAEDTLSPTAKELAPDGWNITWNYSNLISGLDIGMTMPEKLQPGPLAAQISYSAPVSLFFFFFLMFVITTIRNIDLHPVNYFFIATAFFAFHLLLAYLVDHISIHIAMVIASLVSVTLLVSYLRLVVGLRFALLEAGISQLIYLVLFSYAFFWKGFTGLSITVISILTLFVVMQATGRISWAEKFARKNGASGLRSRMKEYLE